MKLETVLGAGGILVGLFFLILGVDEETGMAAFAGLVLLLAGAGLLVYTKQTKDKESSD